MNELGLARTDTEGARRGGLVSEELVPLREATRLVLTPDGSPVHIATLNRWALKGKQGIRLETAKIVRTRYTSREAILRFCVAVGAAPTTAELREKGPLRRNRKRRVSRPELERRRAHEAAKASLRAQGLMD